MSENEAPKSTAYTRTLGLAAETLGGAQALALRLKVDLAPLERWIAGTDCPPHEVFLDALDIVAGGLTIASTARRAAQEAQEHADRLQSGANRAQEAADRVQRHADRAQQYADRRRNDADRADPVSDSGRFRQVKAKDGKPASNNPEDKKKSNDG